MSEEHGGFRYDDKRVLVVGCYSGMGESTAKIVHSLGAEVHGVDYKDPDFELASFTSCDLRSKGEIESMLSSLQGPFDSVFYCAGLPPTHPAIDVMRVNVAAVRAVVEGVQPLVPRGGAISIISSTGGLGFFQHMQEIMELLSTDGFDGAVEWCEQHADTVADGYVEGSHHRLHDETSFGDRRGWSPAQLHQPWTHADADDARIRSDVGC